MRRTLLLLLALAFLCGAMLLGREYLDAHPVLLGAIAAALMAAVWCLW